MKATTALHQTFVGFNPRVDAEAAHQAKGNHLKHGLCAPDAPCCLAALAQIFAPFDPDQPPAYCTVYTHLVKSGGTSLKDQLQRQSVKGGMPKPGACDNSAASSSGGCVAFVSTKTFARLLGER